MAKFQMKDDQKVGVMQPESESWFYTHIDRVYDHNQVVAGTVTLQCNGPDDPVRVFSTMLEGMWDVAASPAARGIVLDCWLSDGYLPPLLADMRLTTGLLANVETLPENTSRAQEAPREHLYLLLVLAAYPAKLVLLVLQGVNRPSVAAAPYIILLAVSVFICGSTAVNDVKPSGAEAHPEPHPKGRVK
ncbi:hypothetical protein DFH07DRAFT_1011952 [Mycena maculata]|uniref:Uncharacterized protein n=1 Tax=Mycena maculata TaxID=230809 RepID=A0AAD7HDF7_9AGAR|nr:hypothetical protein DFH07DRAFT_1011952 [Mycena maculata]